MSSSKKEPFSKILRRERKIRGWTQKELANLLGAREDTIGRWERNEFLPTPFFQQQLPDVFNKSLDELGLLDKQTQPVLFLSFAQLDRTVADDVKRELKKYRFTVCDDDENKLIGEERSTMLHSVFNEVKAIVLIASPNTSSSETVKEELDLAKFFGHPVYVLWTSGRRRKDVLPPQTIVRGIDAIDARGECYTNAIRQLHTTLQQSIASENSQTTTPRNPYKGLHEFQREDANDFFGREHLIDELADQLEQILSQSGQGESNAQFLTIIGPSGSGKSSVLLAGLLPRLQSDEFPGSKNWTYLPAMRPGKHPIKTLATTLESAFQKRNSASMGSIESDLKNEHSQGLLFFAKQLAIQPEEKVILVIDQLEELFTQTADEQERKQFIRLLIDACTEQNSPVVILCTLRADFYDRPMEYPELGSIIENHNKSVFPMNRGELEHAIRCPASLMDVRLTFDEQLVEEILIELQGQIGVLPLLQFTLERLFAQRIERHLTFQAYREIGGVKGALSRHAENTYNDLPTEDHRRLARTLFIRVIDLGTAEQDMTRRRTPLLEFTTGIVVQDQLMQETIDIFVTARLLTVNQLAEIATVEISHEALIREWQRYSLWLQENRKDIHLHQTIRRDVAEWEKKGKYRQRLYRGFQLVEVKEWSRRNTPSKAELEFFKASVARQIRTRTGLIAVGLLVILLLLPLVGSLVGFHTVFTQPVLPGGWWSSPIKDQVVHDELHLAAYAYPSTPVSPTISYVDFTMRWPGNDPWITVCHLTKHTDNNVFQCVVNLHHLGAVPGQIGVSFNVYDQRGNVRQAPNGVRHIMYIPSP